MEITTSSPLPAIAPIPDAEPPAGTPSHSEEVTRWLLEGRFFTVDTAGAITMWSPPAAEAFAWSRRDIVRSRFTDVLLASASGEAHAKRLGALLAGAPDAAAFRIDAVAVDANGARMRVAFAAVPIHVGVGYEFNALLQEIASSSQTSHSLEQLKARGESVLALIDDAIQGRHAELAESEDAQRLAGALVVFQVLERSAPPPAIDDGDVDDPIEAQLADALREAEESRIRAESARARMAEATAESERLRAELADAQERALADSERGREEVIRAREEARADAQRLEAELLATREQHGAEADRLLGELERSRESADAAVERVTSELAAARGAAGQAAEDLTEALRELAEARSQLERRAAELEAANARDGALRAELQALSAEAAEARAQAERTGAELDQARAELDRMRAELDSARRAGEIAAADGPRQQVEAVAAPAAQPDVDEARAAAEAARDEARAATEAARDEARDALAQADSLRHELTEARRQGGRHAAEVEAAQARDAALTAELAALAEQAAQARADADRTRSELEHSEAELAHARGARDAGVAASREEAARLDADLQAARAELHGARGELDRLRGELQTTRLRAEGTAAASREEVAQLTQDLERARDELETVRAAKLPAAKPAAPESAPDARDATAVPGRPLHSAKARASRYLDFVLDVDHVPEEVVAPQQREPIAIQTLLEMAREVDGKNSYTRRHSERVAGYAAALAEGLGFERPRIEAIRQAALLHDVGKSEIPEAIVVKDDPLNLEDQDTLARHSQIGRDLLVAAGEPKLAEWVRHVHERYDGGGHPLGLAGDAIPEESRVLHAVDALDHMTRPRAYRRNRPVREALAELAFCAGTRLDPGIARTLIDLVEQGRIQVEGTATRQRIGRPLGGPRGRGL